jgi:hypothetical protein
MTTQGDPDKQPDWAFGVDQYRDLTKWIVAVFGAIGLGLAGLLPLSQAAHGASEDSRKLLLGILVGLVGVLVTITAAVTSMIPVAISLDVRTQVDLFAQFSEATLGFCFRSE